MSFIQISEKLFSLILTKLGLDLGLDNVKK